MKKSHTIVAGLGSTLALAIILPVTAPEPAAAAIGKERAQRTNIYIQGDSLSVGAGQAIRRKLTPSVNKVTVDAQVGRQTSTGLARTKSAKSAGQSRVWVMALGTNDAPRAAVIKRQIKQSLKISGKKRQVAWVTIQRPGSYGNVNKMMRKYAKKKKRLHLVDWAKRTYERPSLLRSDRVHATHTGYEVRAQMISNTVLQIARTT
jgi:lysophospholipase L1-like esterase